MQHRRRKGDEPPTLLPGGCGRRVAAGSFCVSRCYAKGLEETPRPARQRIGAQARQFWRYEYERNENGRLPFS